MLEKLNHKTTVLTVWFNGFLVRFGSGQVSKILNGSVLTLSNRTELLPIVTHKLNNATM